MQVEFDEQVATIEKIESGVKKAGYQAKVEQETLTLSVEGMTCASCSAAVERTSRKTAGVFKADVNLATEKLTITVDPNAFDLTELKRKVSIAGYKIKSEMVADDHQKKKDHEIKGSKMEVYFGINLYSTITLYRNGSYDWLTITNVLRSTYVTA